MTHPPELRLLRAVAILAQAATISITWPLWQDRADVLPLVALPGVSFAWPLLATLALASFRPRAGAIAHAIVLLLAVVADQTREQPQVLSLALLLLVTRPSGGVYLAALWFWNGLGKLTSARFLLHGGAWLGSPALAVAVGVVEVVLGSLALLPATRWVAAWIGCALHAGILVWLGVVVGHNPAVWPWNVALCVASLTLLRGPRVAAPPAAVVLAAALPVGFHLGWVDAPLAQQVYTMNSCHALALRGGGQVDVLGPLPAMNAHLPRVPRVFAARFAATAAPGDVLVLVDDRPLAARAVSR